MQLLTNCRMYVLSKIVKTPFTPKKEFIFYPKQRTIVTHTSIYKILKCANLVETGSGAHRITKGTQKGGVISPPPTLKCNVIKVFITYSNMSMYNIYRNASF